MLFGGAVNHRLIATLCAAGLVLGGCSARQADADAALPAAYLAGQAPVCAFERIGDVRVPDGTSRAGMATDASARRGILQQAARLGADAVIDITFVEVAVMAVGRAPTGGGGTRQNRPVGGSRGAVGVAVRYTDPECRARH
jgi:hypothetical protein